MHSYYDGVGKLQLPLMRVRATRQHGDRRVHLAGSGFGLQDPTRINRKRAFSVVGKCDRKSRKVPEGETAAEDTGRWNCGGLQLVTRTFMLPF